MPPSESTRLLKAESLRGIGSKIAFNFDDLKTRCDNYIEQIRQQAEKMLTDARTEAEKIKSTAQAEGLSAGQKRGVEQGQKEVDRRVTEMAENLVKTRLSTVMPALQAAAKGLAEERDQWRAEWESSAIRLSIAISERILRTELTTRPELALGMISEALQLAAGNPHIRLRMNPQDITRIGAQAEQILHTVTPQGTAELVADPTISAGGCRVETQHGAIDGTLETQLDRIAAELLEEPGEDAE